MVTGGVVVGLVRDDIDGSIINQPETPTSRGKPLSQERETLLCEFQKEKTWTRVKESSLFLFQ